MPHSPRNDKLPPAATVDRHECLSTDPFQNRGNQEIIDLIDQLLECGINETVGIPQIVVVGDQSSGKSSLLHSLTDVPFPTGDWLCTRFPTQIVSRRARNSRDTIKVSIHENPFSKDRIADVSSFTRVLPSLTSSEFGKLIKEASTLLGVAQHGDTEKSKSFSTSTLKIEITGPTRTPFTITDLPGLFHSSTTEQNEQDIADIKALVASYVTAPGAIVVGVANGGANVATQVVFQIARESDASSHTVGVITKCDTIAETTEVIKLARNQTLPLKNHGWFVVRNRGPKELGMTNEERHSLETKLFSSYPWSQLHESHRGARALRDYLSTLLLQHSRSKLPEIEREIRDRVAGAERDIQELGRSRDSLPKQRQFLQGVVAQFQTAAENALNGHYGSSALLKGDVMRLRKKIVEANREFAEVMIRSGHSTDFKEVEKIPVLPKRDSTPTSSTSPQPKGLFGVGSGAPVTPAKQSTNPRTTGQLGSGSGTGAVATSATRSTSPQPTGQSGGPHVLFGAPATSATQPLSDPFGKGLGAFGRGFGPGGFGTSVTPTTQSVSQPLGSGLFSNLHSSNVFTSPSNGNGGGVLEGAPVIPRQSYEEVGNGRLRPQPPDISVEEAKLVNYRHQSNAKKPPAKFTFPFNLEIDRWIRKEIANHIGTELPGSLNPEVVPALFRLQMAGWDKLAQGHLERIRSIVRACTKSLLRATCKDDAVVGRLETVLSEFDEVAYRRSKAHLDELIRDQREKPLQTSNPRYAEEVQFARRLRFENALARYLQRTGQVDNEEGVITLRDPSSLFEALHISNAENLENEVHDTLKAYYDLEVVSFIDFVNKHIVERYVGGADGSVRSFSPGWAAGLQDSELAELASENPETIAKRKDKEGVLRQFQRAERLLKDHKLSV